MNDSPSQAELELLFFRTDAGRKLDVLFITLSFESGFHAFFSLLLLGGDSAFSVFPNIYDAATTTVNVFEVKYRT